MGFFWSKAQTPLNESLIGHNTPFIMRSCDILLVQSSEFEIAVNSEIWSHVGIIVMENNTPIVFFDGNFISFKDFKQNFSSICIRHCDCIRPSDFDKKSLEAAHEISKIMLQKDADRCSEGFSAGSILGIMGLAIKEQLEDGQLKPHHFSAYTPFKRLELPYHSEHISI